MGIVFRSQVTCFSIKGKWCGEPRQRQLDVPECQPGRCCLPYDRYHDPLPEIVAPGKAQVGALLNSCGAVKMDTTAMVSRASCPTFLKAGEGDV